MSNFDYLSDGDSAIIMQRKIFQKGVRTGAIAVLSLEVLIVLVIFGLRIMGAL